MEGIGKWRAHKSGWHPPDLKHEAQSYDKSYGIHLESFMKQTSFQFLMFLSSTANDTCSKSIQGVFLVDCRHDLVCILGKDMIRKQRLMALLVE